MSIQIAGKVDLDEASKEDAEIGFEIEHLEDFQSGFIFVLADVLVCLPPSLDFPRRSGEYIG